MTAQQVLRCPTCHQPLVRRPGRVCAACEKPITRHHKFYFDGSSVKHKDCNDPEAWQQTTWAREQQVPPGGKIEP